MKTHRKSRWTVADVPVAFDQPIEALAIVFDPLIIYMRVLALKSSFVLVEWINILAELTLDGRYFNDAEATIDIAHFLSSALKECSGTLNMLSW